MCCGWGNCWFNFLLLFSDGFSCRWMTVFFLSASIIRIETILNCWWQLTFKNLSHLQNHNIICYNFYFLLLLKNIHAFTNFWKSAHAWTPSLEDCPSSCAACLWGRLLTARLEWRCWEQVWQTGLGDCLHGASRRIPGPVTEPRDWWVTSVRVLTSININPPDLSPVT